ncbi:MAG: DUF983 domain-containing protein [Gemmatimonadales bacterium]
MPPFPSPSTMIGRALRLRCPVCGGHPIRLSWFTLCPSCPVCGFRLDRHEPGYWLGSYTINLFATEGVFLAVLVTGMALTWPTVPWSVILWTGFAAVLIAPVLLLPFTRTLYLAIDLSFRPPEPPDLVTPRERGFLSPLPDPPRVPSGVAGRERS